MSSKEIIKIQITDERRDSDFFYETIENVDDYDAGEHYSDSTDNWNKVFDFNPHKSILTANKGKTRRNWNSHDFMLHSKNTKFFDDKFNEDEFKNVDFINEYEPATNRVKNLGKVSIWFTQKGSTKLIGFIDDDKCHDHDLKYTNK